jgi:hypothetical protein
MKNWHKGGLLIAVLLMMTVAFAAADEIESDELTELLQDVGETYARGYLAPLISGFGINQNSGLYHTAAIPHTGLSISFAIKGMASEISDDDKNFRTTTRVDLSDFLDPGDPGYGDEGVVVFEGPTVFGAEGDEGTITGYWHGIPVFQETGIEALVDLDYVPTVTPEASIGGIFGLRGTIRWLPTYDAPDIGEIKYMGVGVSWTPNVVLTTLPVDIAVGMFQQSLDVGDILSSTASSQYIAVSKAFSLLTVYGGVAREESSMDVEYTQVDDGEEIAINFELDGVQEKRTTVGVTLNLGVKLNVEMNKGNMTNYSGGIIFGF